MSRTSTPTFCYVGTLVAEEHRGERLMVDPSVIPLYSTLGGRTQGCSQSSQPCYKSEAKGEAGSAPSAMKRRSWVVELLGLLLNILHKGCGS